MFEIFPINGGINAVSGFYTDGVSAGLKKPSKLNPDALDVAFIYSDVALKPFTIFTNNAFRAAPIEHFKQFVEGKKSNFVLINTKNANAMTGQRGIEDVKHILSALKAEFDFIQNPIMSSTGVIGEYLPNDKIISAFAKFKPLENDRDAAARAAKAILTTDAFPKDIALKVQLDSGKCFHIGAMAKGAGMINPALATMLCFITTDAALPESSGEAILKACASDTFNAISVDGDTSTNDSIFLFANGKSGVWDEAAFKAALGMVMLKLSTDIVRDGEGASKLVAFEVKGALNDKEAQMVAKALANSLLVKTAIFGGDPNWGRIASTIGASGASVKMESLSIAFDEVVVFDRGDIHFSKEQEAKAAKILSKDGFSIRCDLGMGNGAFRAYGCDLGHRYVEINADYRS